MEYFYHLDVYYVNEMLYFCRFLMLLNKIIFQLYLRTGYLKLGYDVLSEFIVLLMDYDFYSCRKKQIIST
jgi:hypothetical protein